VERKPKIGLVIGGGGIKCLAAISLFEFLDASKIDIELVVGCSGGAIMAAAYGAGYSSAQMKDIIAKSVSKKMFMNINLRSVAGIAQVPFCKFDKSSGILKSDAIRQLFQRTFGNRKLEDLRPKTIFQATDFQTGEGVILDKGLVADTVYASGALFPILPPLCIDGRWFIDGAFNANVPVMEAVKRNMDIIVVIMFEEKFSSDPHGFVECYYTMHKAMARAMDRSQMSLSVDLHSYEIVVINVFFDKDIQIWDVDKIPLILDTGKKAVDGKKEEILAVIDEFSKSGTH
jgi:NTE family protein